MKKQKNKKRESDGLYLVQVYIGRDENDKRKYKSFYGKTQKDADEQAKKFKSDLKKAKNYTDSYKTFEFWSEKWFNYISVHGNSKGKKIGHSQLSNYQGHVNTLNSYIGKSLLNEISLDDVQSIIDDYSVMNPHTGKPTAKKTLLDLKNTAVNIFSFAMDNDVIYKNPAERVRIPIDAPVTERRALTLAERQMIEDTPNPRGIVNGVPKDKYGMQLPAMIMLYAGLRRGELIALKWSDIDLQQGTITVNKAIEFHDNDPVLKDHTKTKAGMRTVPIGDKLISYLKDVKSDRIRNVNPLVCPSLNGKYYTATSWRTGWNCYMQDLDIKYGTDEEKTSKFQKNHSDLTIDTFTPHCLRHTFGSMLYDAGIDIKTIQIVMGHSDIKTTMNRYVHVDNDHCVEQMKKMNEYLNKKKA